MKKDARRSAFDRRITFLLAVVLTLTGCLPSSCRRVESQAITPADSLSRHLAAQMTPDTLRLVQQVVGPEGKAVMYPRTVLFDPEGRLFVSDVERNSVYTFSAGGAFLEEVTWSGAAVPYLAGMRGDTLLLFNPEARRLDFVLRGALVHHFSTPGDLPREALQYVAVTDEAVYFKAVAKDFAGYLARLDDEGTVRSRTTLPGSYWRHAGMLRPWGDSLLSLSGFRPVVDVFGAALSMPLDTMALVGFDSPMLRRSFAFMQGHATQAPLLSTSAAPVGDRLFVLNVRPGWLRIDVYDRGGRLQHILVERDPAYNKQFYPIDLAVRREAPGRYRIAVAVPRPAPVVKVYDWVVPGA